MPTQTQKYNLYELLDLYRLNDPRANADDKNMAIQAFREATDECCKISISSLINGAAGGLFLFEIVVGLADGVSASTIAITGIIAVVAGAFCFDKKGFAKKQFKDLDHGYQIDPEACGDEDIFKIASGKINKFIEAARPNAARITSPAPVIA